MRRPPTSDFAEFLSARAGSLHRTAILLTHDEQEAHELLVATLVRVRRRWRHTGPAPETDARERMVREYLRRQPRVGRQGVGPEDLADSTSRTAPTANGAESDGVGAATRPALGDPLAGLSPRERAWTVLRSLHAHSVAESARMLRIGDRTGATVEARSLDSVTARSMEALEPVLAAVADSYPPPDTRSLTAALRARAPGDRRRRLVATAMAVATVIALVIGAGSFLTDEEERSEVVRAAETDPDYEAGYGLVDGRPRPYVDGLALQKVEVIDYALRRKTVSAPEVDEGSPLYAVAYCDLPGNTMDVDAVLDAITVEPHDSEGQVLDSDSEPQAAASAEDPDAARAVDLSCVDRRADSASAPVISPLPGDVEDFTVTVPSVWSGTGALYLAFYTEVPWSAYPFGSVTQDAAPPPDPATGSVVDAATKPASGSSLGSLLDGQEATVRSVDVDIDTTLELTVRTSEPGQLLVALDGVVVTNDGEDLTGLGRSRPGPWSQADPALRHGFWRGYAASGYHRYLDSGTLARMGVDITDDTVTVSVIERGFNGDGWQVVATTDGGGAPMALAPGYADSLPEYANGLRRVAAYQVPTDGEPHAVPLSARQAEQLTWVGACDIETPREVRAVTLVSPERSGLIPCASYRNEWAAPLMPLTAEEARAPTEPDDDSDAELTLTTQRTTERTSVAIGAYAPVPYQDFPFEAAGQPSTSPLNLRPVPDEGELVSRTWASDRLSAWTEVDALSTSQLDGQGRGRLTVSTDGRSLVRVSTRGRGRFKIQVAGGERPLLDGMFYDPSVLGRVASPLMYRDGWWTSWTVDAAQWAIPLRRDVAGSRLTLDVTAEGYDPGSLDIRVLEATGVEANR